MNEKQYDRIYNEGGEGYNPIRQAKESHGMEMLRKFEAQEKIFRAAQEAEGAARIAAEIAAMAK